MTRSLLFLALLLVTSAAPAAAQVVEGKKPQPVRDVFVREPPGVAVATWTQGLETPWSLVFLPDRSALVSERPGRIRLIEADGKLAAAPYATLPVNASGEGGLMGLALHPDFPRAPFVYAMLTLREDGNVINRVVRLRHGGTTGSVEKIILDGLPGARFHDGGRIAFGPDGMLYVTAGDATHPDLAQNLASLGGKILRVTPDGAIPADNPFPNSPVWSLGHRNPQGLAWHPATKELFAAEHGPSGEFGLRARDEVNVVRKGANYGWPRVTCAGGQQGFVDPILCWPEVTMAPGGIAFLGEELFVATLRGQSLLRIGLARDGGAWRVTAVERWFAASGESSVYGRLRDVVPGPDGALYVLTSNRDGRGSPRAGDDRILRVAPAG